MNSTEEPAHLFSYGTLQDEAVQLATFGRKLIGTADTLPGYRQALIPIKDQRGATADQYHLNAEFTGRKSDFVEGTRFEVTTAELEEADVYEGTADYKRIRVDLKSGTRAWVYVHSEQ